jgi:uncharacterized protein (DUF736 family)
MEQKKETGVLFLNDKKESENHPDMTGNLIDSNGKKWRLAAWSNTSMKGAKYLSIKMSEFQTQAAPQTAPVKANTDEAPF